MSIFSIISDIFKPAAKLVDNIHTSGEEKLQLRNKLAEIENAVLINILTYEKQLITLQASVIRAEATGQSFLQRSWRPITMLSFLILIILDCFGLLAFRLSTEAWGLLKLGLGGYVIGRSAERVVPGILRALKK